MNRISLFVPGRLCLFGEHSDWAGRYCTMNGDLVPGAAIVCGVEQGIYAEAILADRFEIVSEAPELKDFWSDFSCAMSETELKDIAKSGSFFSYCAGVASYVLEWHKVGGIKINIKSMTLPIKGGLSSSAAICVLVARAFNQLYNLNLSTRGEMNIAYMGEMRTSSRCGRLDQACAFGNKPVFMEFNGDEMEVSPLKVGADFHWVFADLCAGKNTKKILRDLNKAYPFASNDQELALQDALGPSNREIIRRASEFLANGAKESLGALMDEAQALFDKAVAPACIEELAAPKLHSILSDSKVRSLIYGGKGVGSQGDGSVQFLAKDKDTQKELIEYLNSIGMKAYSLTIQPTHTVHKAIVPVAGFGTRMYPATKTMKKDFLPVVDSRDGMVKPTILIILEELVDSGIDEICIVLGSKEERQQYKDFFETSLSVDHLTKLNETCRKYEERILNIGKKLTYVYQKEKLGFGHAVYQCCSFVGNDPVLLVLGDTIYHNNSGRTCTQQMIEAFDQYDMPLVSIHEIPLTDVSSYGVISGIWEDSKEKAMVMEHFVEKPSASYAEEYLGVLGEDYKPHYYSVFGQYILTPDVFVQLSEAIEKGNNGKEIDLTSTLDNVRQMKGMIAIKIDGKMFDIGNPRAYRETVSKY